MFSHSSLRVCSVQSFFIEDLLCDSSLRVSTYSSLSVCCVQSLLIEGVQSFLIEVLQ